VTRHAGAPPPTNDEGSRCNASPQVEQEMERANCGTAAQALASRWPDDPQTERQRVDALDRRIDAVQQRAASAGWQCHMLPTGLVFTRWGRATEAMSLDAAEAFVTVIDGGARDAR
jgi:hypothetical protein